MLARVRSEALGGRSRRRFSVPPAPGYSPSSSISRATRRRDEPVDRLAGRHAARISLDDTATGGISKNSHPLGLLDRVEHRRRAPRRRSRDASRRRGGRRGAPRSAAPRSRKSAKRSAPTRNIGSPQRSRTQRTVSNEYAGCGRSTSIRETSAPGTSANAASASAQPDLRIRRDRLAGRAAGRRHEQPVEPEVLDARARERDVTDVRRVERPAEQPDRSRDSSVSSPTTTSSPRFDAGGAERTLELLRVGRRTAGDAVAAVGAQHAVRAPPRLRAGRRGSRPSTRSRPAGSGSAGGTSSNSARRNSSRPGARRAREREHAQDPLVLDLERRRLGSRSILFSTTICGRSSRPAP